MSFNVDGFIPVYDLGLAAGQGVSLEEIRVVAVDDIGNPVDPANLTITLHGWISDPTSGCAYGLCETFTVTDLPITNIVYSFGTTTTLGGFFTVDTLFVRVRRLWTGLPGTRARR